jgi:hypothetical protein
VTRSKADDERHVSTETFDRYLDSRTRIVFPVEGDPKMFVFIDPMEPELGLRVEVPVNTDAPETGLRNILTRIAVRDGTRFFEVVITDSTLFREAYPVLRSIADRVQVRGYSPAAAVRATLEKMSSLLRAPESMSREREVGLFGELLVLAGTISALGATDAIQAWRGGLAEEHDFGFPDLDLEVKTTTSERRLHWIESLTQLVPTRDRPLWLVSHQLTAAGAGDGHTLPELVDVVRDRVRSGATGDAFEKALSGSGWREEDSERLVTRWTRRAESTAYLVADSFPRLTPDALRHGGLSIDHIREVRYRVDLDGLTHQPATPQVIATAIGFEGWT